MKQNFSINNYYHSLGKKDKQEKKKLIIKELKITESAFYVILFRDKVPKKHKPKLSSLLNIEIA